MHQLKIPTVKGQKIEKVRTNELKGVVRLRSNVNSDDIETGQRVAHARTPGTAEGIEQ
jgi:hypothetical protein